MVDDGAVTGGVGIGLLPPQAEGGIEGAGGAGDEVVVDAVDALALAVLACEVGGLVHDVEDGDGFEQLDFGFGLLGHDEVAVHAAKAIGGDEIGIGLAGGANRRADIAADELRGHLLQVGVVAQGIVKVADGVDDA